MTDSNAGLKPVIIGNQIMLDGEVLVQVGGSVEALIMWCLAHYVFPFNYQGGKKTPWSLARPQAWSPLAA